MRRILAFPLLLVAAALSVALPMTRLGAAADRFGRRVCRWGRDPSTAW